MTSFALLALALTFQTQTPGSAPLPVHLQGNLVLANEVYLAVLKLPLGSQADEPTATLVETQLREFLLKAGYELARVRAVVRDGAIEVELHEGRLEKVVFRGTLTLKSLQFKLGLYLPHDVFNRPALDRHIQELTDAIGLRGVTYQLVPSQNVKHEGPQLENLGSYKGTPIIHAREPYELHFIFDQRWDTGFGLDLRSGYFDGLETGLNYQGKSLLRDGDQWRAAASIGFGIREKIDGGRYYPNFSRTTAEFRWMGSEALFRPRVELESELIARQRRDLNLENYYAITADLRVRAELTLPALESARVSVGLGIRFNRFFGLQVVEGQTIPDGVGTLLRYRTFAELAADAVFDVPGQRWDRRHDIEAFARQYFAINDPFFGEARFRYQKVFEFGWHDLWLGARGAWLWGEVPFHNEELVAG
ncbi:MAG: hypothetical protein ACT4TC_24795, partial [Myxococcaceae bacterium]